MFHPVRCSLDKSRGQRSLIWSISSQASDFSTYPRVKVHLKSFVISAMPVRSSVTNATRAPIIQTKFATKKSTFCGLPELCSSHFLIHSFFARRLCHLLWKGGGGSGRSLLLLGLLGWKMGQTSRRTGLRPDL